MAPQFSGETAWRRSRQVVRGAVPAGGASPSVTVPAGHLYRLKAAYAALVTDATVANRIARLQFSDGVATFLEIGPAGVQAASSTFAYAWLPGASGYALQANEVMPLPELELQAGWVISLVTTNLVAGDAWSALALIVDDITVQGGGADLNNLPDLRVEVVGGLTP